eukprot:TRINITY_DN14427_c0_g1_i3.p1 TRINITY_DN14427_c0_g1~~TRINITY_DN14427_c0_g1_i3.p1  ORF type:complete len:187 (-),score=45.05 TRINITY_DN14427_c0_g1_i3:79-639(-)
MPSLVGSEMCIRDSINAEYMGIIKLLEEVQTDQLPQKFDDLKFAYYTAIGTLLAKVEYEINKLQTIMKNNTYQYENYDRLILTNDYKNLNTILENDHTSIKNKQDDYMSNYAQLAVFGEQDQIFDVLTKINFEDQVKSTEQLVQIYHFIYNLFKDSKCFDPNETDYQNKLLKGVKKCINYNKELKR